MLTEDSNILAILISEREFVRAILENPEKTFSFRFFRLPVKAMAHFFF
jgi:hypothetical protein